MSRLHFSLFWVFAMLAALLYWRPFSPSAHPQDAAIRPIGTLVFPDLTTNSIASVEMQAPLGSVHLTQSNGAWLIQERDDYPANTRLIASALKRLSQLRVLHSLPCRPDQWEKFGVDPQKWQETLEASLVAAKGEGVLSPFKLTLRDAQQQTLAELWIGSTTWLGTPEASGGRFLRFPDQPDRIYLIDEEFKSLNLNARYWLQTEFLQLAPALRVETLPTPDPKFVPWVFFRKSLAEFPRVENMRPGQRLRRSETEALALIFKSLEMQEVLNESQAAPHYRPELERTILIDSNDGVRTRLRFAPLAPLKSGGSVISYLCRFSFEASPITPQKPDPQRLAALSPLSKRVFQVSHQALKPLMLSRDQLFEDPLEVNPNEITRGNP